jgi:hypothetical protein
MRSGDNAVAKGDDFFEDGFRRFADDHLFAVDKGKDSVGRFFDKLNEIGVEHERLVVEARELNHGSARERLEVHAWHQSRAVLVESSAEVRRGSEKRAGSFPSKIGKFQ